MLDGAAFDEQIVSEKLASQNFVFNGCDRTSMTKQITAVIKSHKVSLKVNRRFVVSVRPSRFGFVDGQQRKNDFELTMAFNNRVQVRKAILKHPFFSCSS